MNEKENKKLTPILRKAWMFYSEKRKEAFQVSKIKHGMDKGSYVCACCGKLETRKSDVIIDHIYPCKGFKGDVDSVLFLDNLFHSKQILLCKSCSDLKTKDENTYRKLIRESRVNNDRYLIQMELPLPRDIRISLRNVDDPVFSKLDAIETTVIGLQKMLTEKWVSLRSVRMCTESKDSN